VNPRGGLNKAAKIGKSGAFWNFEARKIGKIAGQYSIDGIPYAYRAMYMAEPPRAYINLQIVFVLYARHTR
jgi:hypothetical protein